MDRRGRLLSAGGDSQIIKLFWANENTNKLQYPENTLCELNQDVPDAPRYCMGWV